MTQHEQRRSERINLTTQPKGDLFLHVQDNTHKVRTVLNISPQGVSVRLDSLIAVAAAVTLQYKYKQINMQVNGTVVWSRPANAPEADGTRPYDIGVNLISPHLLFSLLPTRPEQ